MDCSPARVLEWGAISFSRRSSQPRDWTRVSRSVGRHFTIWATREAPDDFNVIENALADKGIDTASAEITQVPDTTVTLNDKDAEKMQKLLDALDEDDDVQNVYGNYEF